MLQKTDDIGFLPNEGKNARGMILCYSDLYLPHMAYKKLIENKGSDRIDLYIDKYKNTIDVKIRIQSNNREIVLKNRTYNHDDLDFFLKVNGGGPYIILLVGYPPASQRHIVLEKGISPLVVKWEIISKEK